MPARRTGRPGREPIAGERVGLSLRVTAETKRALDEAATKSGRSLSQEAEYRLEGSFRDQSILPQILDLAYGRQAAGLLLLLGRCLSTTRSSAAFAEGGSLDAVENWMMQPWTFQQVEGAVSAVLKALRPEGEAEMPKALSLKGGPVALQGLYKDLGHRVAEGYLSALVDPTRNEALETDMLPIHARLAEIVITMKGVRRDR